MIFEFVLTWVFFALAFVICPMVVFRHLKRRGRATKQALLGAVMTPFAVYTIVVVFTVALYIFALGKPTTILIAHALTIAVLGASIWRSYQTT